eukprot:TRINITY_DN24197_c0_g2_i2.p1 TRINITY_DN24197_c0_g2~~TRINITY_DN24197_c0_g2_i2.p1  ORF type:complete len:526 (-),score=88.27 TRINITY_DN24197_c0_g2_i2:26-1576(-)
MARLVLLLAVQAAAGSRIQGRASLAQPKPVSITPLVRRDSDADHAHKRGVLGRLGDALAAPRAAWAPPMQGTELSPRQMKDLQRHRRQLGSTARVHRRARHNNLRSTSFRFGAMASGSNGETRLTRGVLRLEDLSDSEYVGLVGIGTASPDNCNVSGQPPWPCPLRPVVELRVVYDTGSSDFWVASDLCTTAPCVYPHRHRFNHTLSTTFRAKPVAERFETLYNSGQLAGTLGADNVWVGPMMVSGQQIGLIEEVSGVAFSVMPIDGIVGLGFADLAVKTRPLLDNLQANVPRPQFAFFLHSNPAMGGAVIWGEGSEHLGLHEGRMHWFPVVEERYWSLSLLGFRMGNTSKRQMLGLIGMDRRRRGDGPASFSRMSEQIQKCLLVVDTGTTYFTAPPRLFNAIAEMTTPRECSKISAMPAMVFTLQTSMLNKSSVEDLIVPPEVYMVRSFDQDWCTPGIMLMGSDADEPPMMILGEVFMRHHFSIFQKGAQHGSSWIGFAPAVSGPEAEKKLLLVQ